ncbi:MAG: thymidine phosphorylase [Microthrixaceae bacterium]|nr:thymidine phosphorylase [Microthrixaceae bacterium]
MSTTILDVIRTKRDGGALSDEQIRWFITGYTAHEVADEQAAALLMAIVWRGMTERELRTWTGAMIDSGIRMDLSGVPRPTVDKHSTGGVGDKISLPLCPLVAACGAAVPQLSGRGLGHTGGTLDKMESIPGWSATVAPDRYLDLLEDPGAVICAAGDDLAPADRRLYALRDVTATVESIPLIASSIMSKKIAEGTGALVLDVKFGSGAFMVERNRAAELAATMVELGEAAGVRTAALLTAMDIPLGNTAGNALEVQESLEVLSGGGPADVVELTVALAELMCELAGVDADPSAVLRSGAAMDTWRRMVRSQGGDPDAALPVAPHVETIAAEADGVLGRLDARHVGEAAWRLGAGRSRKEEAVSAVAGVRWHRRPGDRVSRGDVLVELHTGDPTRLPAAVDALEGAWEIGSEAPERVPLVSGRIG